METRSLPREDVRQAFSKEPRPDRRSGADPL